MGSCDGRERARHFRRVCIDRDEQAGGGFAEGHIEARAVGAEIQCAALESVVEAPSRARRLPRQRFGSCRRAQRRFIQHDGPARQHLAVRKIECERLPALCRLAARDVEAIALPVDDRRGENPRGNAVEQVRLELARRSELRAPENRSCSRAGLRERSPRRRSRCWWRRRRRVRPR